MGSQNVNCLELESNLLKIVSHYLEESGLGQQHNKLIAAVSGGPDSLALLLLLAKLRQPLGLNIHVAHLNHCLRGEESHMDAQFVRDVATSLNLPSTVEEGDVQSYRRDRHGSLEEAAREVRYSFLQKTANKQATNLVVLGHTADDQAETILMHLLRGSGLSGMRGMPSVGHWPSKAHSQQITLIRPLLQVTRESTKSYCLWKGITPREDSSNNALQFTRNRLRSDLLPLMKSYNPKFQEALVRLGRSVTQDLAYIAQEAVLAKEMLAVNLDEGIAVYREGFVGLAPALKRHLLRLIYQDITGTINGLAHQHIENMVSLSRATTVKHMDLPSGLIFSTDQDFLRIIPREAHTGYTPITLAEYPLKVPSDIQIPGWLITARISIPSYVLPDSGKYTIRLDEARVGRSLVLRGRRPGDRFQPLGMTGTKKLQDFMVDAKIPREKRGLVPLVLSENRIACVVGHRIAQWAMVAQDTQHVVCLEFSPTTPM